MNKCECKNCVHYEVCEKHNILSAYNDTIDQCDHYKDKSLCVELPCIRYSKINKAWAVDYYYRDCLHTTLCATEESAEAKLKELEGK